MRYMWTFKHSQNLCKCYACCGKEVDSAKLMLGSEWCVFPLAYWLQPSCRNLPTNSHILFPYSAVGISCNPSGEGWIAQTSQGMRGESVCICIQKCTWASVMYVSLCLSVNNRKSVSPAIEEWRVSILSYLLHLSYCRTLLLACSCILWNGLWADKIRTFLLKWTSCGPCVLRATSSAHTTTNNIPQHICAADSVFLNPEFWRHKSMQRHLWISRYGALSLLCKGYSQNCQNTNAHATGKTTGKIGRNWYFACTIFLSKHYCEHVAWDYFISH